MMAPRCATVVAWGSLDLCHPHHACLALSHQPRSCPCRPFHKATHRKSKTKEKSCVALGGVRPQKGAQPKQPLAKGIPLVWGRGRGSLAQALSMFPPSLDVQGVPSGRQREDEEAITPHPKTDRRAHQDPCLPTGITQLHARGQLRVLQAPGLAWFAVPLPGHPLGVLRPGRGAPRGQ